MRYIAMGVAVASAVERNTALHHTHDITTLESVGGFTAGASKGPPHGGRCTWGHALQGGGRREGGKEGKVRRGLVGGSCRMRRAARLAGYYGNAVTRVPRYVQGWRGQSRLGPTWTNRSRAQLQSDRSAWACWVQHGAVQVNWLMRRAAALQLPRANTFPTTRRERHAHLQGQLHHTHLLGCSRPKTSTFAAYHHVPRPLMAPEVLWAPGYRTAASDATCCP